MGRSSGHRRGRRNCRRVLLCSYSACLPVFMILMANSLLSAASLDSNLKKMTQIVDALKSRLGISNRVEVRILESNAGPRAWPRLDLHSSSVLAHGESGEPDCHAGRPA
jgi:hypothetical protein